MSHIRTRARYADLAPLSVYHEPWWLDIACDGEWNEAIVRENGVIVARMPYANQRYFGLAVSDMPSLVRTLGPAVACTGSTAVGRLRRRIELTDKLIEQLPHFDTFGQLFDPDIDDAVSFLYRGFHLSSTYAFRMAAAPTDDAIWVGMNDKTRNGIRKASLNLRPHTIDARDFTAFHEANLEGRNKHGQERLNRLLTAMLERGAGTLLCVSDASGKLVAATAIAYDARAAYYLISTRTAGAPSGATSLLIWEAIKIARQRGIAFDFDGVVSKASLQFLSGFGGCLVPRIRVRRVSVGTH